MRLLLILFLTALVGIFPASIFAARPNVPTIPGSVCIDPGHGGSDIGTSNGGIAEKNLNLEVSFRLRDILLGNSHTVFMTRTDDSNPSRSDRATYCESQGAAILVSVHHNGSTDHSIDYSLALYSKRSDIDLARAVVDAVAPAVGNPNRGISRFASGVLVKSSMPATISEGYFLTSDNRLAQLNDPNQDLRGLEAQAIYQGITSYFSTH